MSSTTRSVSAIAWSGPGPSKRPAWTSLAAIWTSCCLRIFRRRGEYYRRSYDTRQPLFGAIDAPTRTGGRFTYEFGLFPLRKGGHTVDQFVALEDYFDLGSSLEELVEWRDRKAD